MFLDEVELHIQAGNGGAGSVHFARRKYEPFAGPDGGDGGDGGDVVLVGQRDIDTLEHLRTASARGKDGVAGAGNQRIGARGGDCVLPVGLGTIAVDAASGELGSVCRNGARLILAHGGKGGLGNPRYATGRRRAPKIAGLGKPGDELQARLLYRIYNDTALVEPGEPHALSLLPRLLDQDAAFVDYDLFRRKPRWIRHEHNFRRFDTAYAPLDLDALGGIAGQLLRHLYWSQHVFINLAPIGMLAETTWRAIWEILHALPLRRLERITLCTWRSIEWPEKLHSLAGEVQLDSVAAAAQDDIYARFAQQLTGGIVD